MRKKINLVVWLVIIFIIFYFINSLFSAPSREAQVVNFSVAKGGSVAKIAHQLDNDHLIKSELVFKLYVWLSGQSTKILAGNYRLSTDMSLKTIVTAMTTGESIDDEITITLIEGWRAVEIGKYLAKLGLVTEEEFLAAIKTKNWRDKYDFLKNAKAETLEGFLFPDTYRVFSDATAEDIVAKLLNNFDNKVFQPLNNDLSGNDHSLFEIITMASIVEQEGKFDSDRKMIADIFWKRLDAGMGLQSDATVNYATGKSVSRASSVDLQIDSPYNTYKYRGLPPGPICSPGLSSIKAALYPEKNNYYFFLTDKNGKAIFAENYDQHQANIRKYLD